MGPYNLKKIHEFSLRNKKDILNSNNVGCFYCLKISSKNDIIIWEDRRETALCPHCGIDSLLPDNIICLTQELLKAMHEYWFEARTHCKEISLRQRLIPTIASLPETSWE